MKTQHHSLAVFALFIATAALLGGCASNYKTRAVTDTSRQESEPWVWKKCFGYLGADGPQTRGEYLNPYTYNPSPASATRSKKKADLRANSLYTLAASGTDPEARRQARNQLQNAILVLSDNATARHLAGLKATENFSNLVLGGAAIGLSSGATVAAVSAAKALSAASAGAGGFRGLVNEQLYRDALGETIVRSIETDRAQFLANIIVPNQKRPVAEYDVAAALREANEYHHRGSFYHGLALVRESAEKANAEAKDDANKARKADSAVLETLRADIMKALVAPDLKPPASERFAQWQATASSTKLLPANAPTELGLLLHSNEVEVQKVLPSLLEALRRKNP